MNLALWIVTGVLAAAFTFSGAFKLVSTREKLGSHKGAGWVEDFSAPFIKFLGAVEVLGGLGLVLPGVTGIAPVLVPVAAVCLAALMAGAFTVMVKRGEYGHSLVNAVYFALLVFVTWGRFGAHALG